MTKGLAIAVFMFISLILSWPVRSQEQAKAKEIVGEGVVVAFQKKHRCPSCKASGGLGTFVEYWIVRIDKWSDGTGRDEKHILVEFNIYKRGLSDREINSGGLRFTLRERREDEHTDCLGEVVISREPTYQTRPVEPSDYERTEPGKLDEIPPLESLPCLIADSPPVVVQ